MVCISTYCLGTTPVIILYNYNYYVPIIMAMGTKASIYMYLNKLAVVQNYQ